MYNSNTKPYTLGNFKTNPFIRNPNKDELVFKTNIVFGSLPIGNPADISLNVIEHILEADIILVESNREFSRLITRVNDLMLRTNVDLQPGASIYQYQYESEPGKADGINSFLLSQAKEGKNIFVVSDEGCSVFLEPAQDLKQSLVAEKISYTVLPGPFSGFSAITNTDFPITQFFFGESLPALPAEARKETYRKMKVLLAPTVFLLTAVDARWCISELSEHFLDGWTLDFQMSLTMGHETHIYGTAADIIDYIDSNAYLFDTDTQLKKFSVVLYPDKNLQTQY